MLKRATDRIGVGNHRSFDCMRDGTTSSSALVFELCHLNNVCPEPVLANPRVLCLRNDGKREADKI